MLINEVLTYACVVVGRLLLEAHAHARGIADRIGSRKFGLSLVIASQCYRFNDDGEPSGTAGKPILAAIDRQSLDSIAVVVTRWFVSLRRGPRADGERVW